ncbi:MAG: putative sulfate exporter family transporter [Pseudomonadota bacterium]|nr:putative sulfate exporter family transporter [Pseudomonadota bacterium]
METGPGGLSASVFTERVRRLFPGVAVCVVVAFAARSLAEHYGAPQMLFALLLGMALHFLSEDGRCRPGIDFCSAMMLRTGVALLGLRITLDQVTDLGLPSILWVMAGVGLTVCAGWLGGRLLGLGNALGVHSGGAVAICGASAALALAAAMPRHPNLERDTSIVVIIVTALSTVAMVIYPVIATMLGLDMRDAGLFLGGTIHDVAQVVGAGYGMSGETGDTATVTKLFRVALLVPVVLAIGLLLSRTAAAPAARPRRIRPPLPIFLVAFCILTAINSAGWVPAMVGQPLVDLSGWLLVTAIAAIGVKTSLKAVADTGPRPLVLMIGESLLLACWVLAGQLWVV